MTAGGCLGKSICAHCTRNALRAVIKGILSTSPLALPLPRGGNLYHRLPDLFPIVFVEQGHQLPYKGGRGRGLGQFGHRDKEGGGFGLGALDQAAGEGGQVFLQGDARLAVERGEQVEDQGQVLKVTVGGQVAGGLHGDALQALIVGGDPGAQQVQPGGRGEDLQLMAGLFDELGGEGFIHFGQAAAEPAADARDEFLAMGSGQVRQ